MLKNNYLNVVIVLFSSILCYFFPPFIIIFSLYFIYLIYQSQHTRYNFSSNLKEQIKEEIINTQSYNHHLAGFISGLNHELSPWLAGINITTKKLLETENDYRKIEKLMKIQIASQQTFELLKSFSGSIQKVKNFSVFNSNVLDTIKSWTKILLMERNIKENISSENIQIDFDSLDFTALHSPMFLSQVILNLAKNSIDHNKHMLDTLKIHIHGNKVKKCVIYEDNGKGIPQKLLNNIFNSFGVSTKEISGEIHGFGLYSCLQYCISMNAVITAESEEGKYTRFVIKFDRISDEEISCESDYPKSVKK